MKSVLWGRGSYITLFLPSSHSKRFSVTSVSFTEWEKCRAHDRPVQASIEAGAQSSTILCSTEAGAAGLSVQIGLMIYYHYFNTFAGVCGL